MPTNWFEQQFQIKEDKDFNKIHDKISLIKDEKATFPDDFNLLITDGRLRGKKFKVGRFELIKNKSLAEDLVKLNKDIGNEDQLTFSAVTGDVKELILKPENEGSVFQVSSRLNCLERSEKFNDTITQIGYYEKLRTQGAVCSIACPAGTVFRNYFLCNGINKYSTIKNYAGQRTAEKNVNLIDEQQVLHLEIKNGISGKFVEHRYMYETSKTIEEKKTSIIENIKVGILWNATTRSELETDVCQVFCGALNCKDASTEIKKYATYVMQGIYEATFRVAALKCIESRARIKLFLTRVGSRELENSYESIEEAVALALTKFKKYPIDVQMVFQTAMTKDTRMSNIQKFLQKIENDEETRLKAIELQKKKEQEEERVRKERALIFQKQEKMRKIDEKNEREARQQQLARERHAQFERNLAERERKEKEESDAQKKQHYDAIEKERLQSLESERKQAELLNNLHKAEQERQILLREEREKEDIERQKRDIERQKRFREFAAQQQIQIEKDRAEARQKRLQIEKEQTARQVANFLSNGNVASFLAYDE